MLTVDLRLQLLEPEKYPYLFKCLYGLLMLLPQSSAFATLRNRLNSISPIGYLHLFPRPYVPISTPTNFLSAAETSSRLDRRGPKAKADEIKWQELLDKFRSVQLRHEKARTRQPLLPRSPHLDTAPPTPAITQKRSVSTAHQPAPSAPSHKRGGRSIHTITQGILNAGRSSGDGKKNAQSGKRA
jgi:vacuole morphology and inheritance protein 14